MAEHVVSCEDTGDFRVLTLYMTMSQITGLDVDDVRNRIHAIAGGRHDIYA